MEKSGKSTGVQAALLAPDNVTVYLTPDFPDYSDRLDKVALVYPKRDAKTLSSSHDDVELYEFLKNVETFVIIDCTWNQTNGMLKDERLSKLRSFALTSYETQYWRPQHKKPQASLATIEAIYYFCLEYDKYINWNHDKNRSVDYSYDARYDNLLFFYEYFRRKVGQVQEERKRKATDDDIAWKFFGRFEMNFFSMFIKKNFIINRNIFEELSNKKKQ